MPQPFHATALALPLGAALLLAPSSRGNVIVSYTNSTKFTYSVSQMPDFDQHRKIGSGFPGLDNEGKMYCVPVATANVLSYVQAHGYHNLMPVLDFPYTYWTGYSGGAYSVSTIGLNLLGIAMSTDPIDGTGGAGFQAGVDTYFDPATFCVSHQWASGNYSPTAKEIGNAAIGGVSGSLVVVVVGWYNSGGGNSIMRAGGHALTLKELSVDGSNVDICWRDPWTTDSSTVQSPFSTECYDTLDSTVTVGGKTRTMTKVVGYGNAYIDEYMMIRPIFGLTTTTDGLQLKLKFPLVFEAGGASEKTIPSAAPIVDFALHPNLSKVYYITKLPGASGLLWQTNEDGTSTALGEFGNPTKIAVGRKRQVYVMDGLRTIRCYNFDVVPPTSVTYTAPFDLADMDYDDTTDTLFGLSAVAKSLLKITWGAAGASGTPIPLPSFIPALNPATASLDMNPFTGEAVLGADNVDAIWATIQLASGGMSTQTITDPIVKHPKSINVDGAGRIMFMSDGVARVLHKTRTGWVEDPSAAFDGVPVPSGKFLMAIGRSNFDPAEHSGPAWINVLPTAQNPSTPDCDADLNLDGKVDGADLAVVLSQWGGDGIADLNDDDVVDAADLATLLGLWGLCP